MKVLYISGGDDYHFVTFENQTEFTIDKIVEICENSPKKQHTFEVEDDYFDAELYEFGDVDEKFIQFIKSKQDSDDIKHSNWIVIK